MREAKGVINRSKWLLVAAVLVISQVPPVLFASGNAKAATFELASSSGTWTDTDGGTGITGINTNEVRWGNPSNSQNKKSGLKFAGSTNQSFNEGEKFLLGELTHYNWTLEGGTAADGADLKIVLAFTNPTISPNPDFTFNFDINETPNQSPCPAFQITNTPCDDKITFPNSYGSKSFTIGDKLYTLKIEGFTNCGNGNTPVSQFITEESKDNSACLYGSISSVLVDRPQLTLVEKAVNSDDADVAPGPTLYVGDTASFTYKVQNTGNVTLTNITVTDDKGVTVTCPKTTLVAGELMTCTGSAAVVSGAYKNTAYASGKYSGTTYKSNNEVANYTGAPKPGNVTVTKVVVNDDGGTAVVADFPLFVGGTAVTSGVAKSFAAGTYTITETQKTGYAQTTISGDCYKYQGAIKIAVVANQTVACTITNNDKPPKLTLKKKVVNTNGGTASASNWTLTATPEQNSVGATVLSGNGYNGFSNKYAKANVAYTLTESGPSGYAFVKWSCDGGTLNGNVLTLGLNEDVECEVENNDIAPSLTLVKNLIKDNGGTANAADWTLKATGSGQSPTNLSGATGTAGATSGSNFKAGTYTLSETGGPSGYTKSTWSCTNGVTVNANSQITLTVGQTTVCTITNDDDKPGLTLIKNLVNEFGGTASETDWTLTATGPTTVEGPGGATSDSSFDAGTYVLSESGPTKGFTASGWQCVGGSIVEGALKIVLGQQVTCTITNTSVQPKLTVTKIVDNKMGGTKKVSDFPLNVSGNPVVSGESNGFNVGDYTVGETGDPNYTATYSGDCDKTGNVSLTYGDVKECIITNTSKGGTIIINKVVINDDDGESTAGDFSVKVNGGESKTFIEDSEDPLLGQVIVNVPAGYYTVLEDQEDENGYFTVYENDCEPYWDYEKGFEALTDQYNEDWNENDCYPGDCEEMYVGLGETVTCTITNDDEGEGTGRSVDLAIDKTDNDVKAEGNGSFNYEIAVSNNGNTTAYNVVMEDEIPETLKVTSINAGAWDCEVTGADSNGFGGTLVCTLPFLAGGDEADTITLNVLVAEDATGFIENTACVDSTQRDYNSENNCSTAETPVKSIDVVLLPICRNNFPYMSYKITLTNFTANKATFDWYSVTPGDDLNALQATQTVTSPGQVSSFEGEVLWPGASLIPEDWPGWVLENGEWVETRNDAGGKLRPQARVEVSVNPMVNTPASYPEATANCDPNPQQLADTGTAISFGSALGALMLFGSLAAAIPARKYTSSRNR